MDSNHRPSFTKRPLCQLSYHGVIKKRRPGVEVRTPTLARSHSSVELPARSKWAREELNLHSRIFSPELYR